MRNLCVCIVLLVLSSSLALAKPAVSAEAIEKQIEDLKQVILNLSKDADVMQQQVLYPPNVRVKVFVSMDSGQLFELKWVKLELDGKLVSSYMYSEMELEGLKAGAMHELFLGSYKPGKHELVATFNGVGPRGKPYERMTRHQFEKTREEMNIELKIADSASTRQPEFLVQQW
ncbi:MAG: hypothetical protein OEZ58_00690 [Gammaproteobacteria bacterium]|nr:hypothetical protein [Gammaproteobacteria bacterium]MDH5727491.1 hypothetical protein [Gammaproteobacteria bacterium]